MKLSMLSLLMTFTVCCYSQADDEQQIRQSLAKQTESWNRGDIAGFMDTYWKNDSLMFIGKSGVHWGWDATLENYIKGYPDTVAMGKLSFEILQVKRLSPEYYFVVGKWMLSRTIGDLSGHYNLLFKKINGRWVIIADHSS